MAFGAELRDFVAGFKTGRDMVTDSEDRKFKRDQAAKADERYEDETGYRRGRDALSDSRYDTALADRERRYGIQDEQWAITHADTVEEREANRALRQMEIEQRNALKADPDGSAEGFTPGPAEGIPDVNGAPTSDEHSALETPAWLEYANAGAIRDKPLSPELQTALASVAPEMGIKVKVFSGGQEGSRRTGSTRHNHGNAADIFLYDNNGRKLDWNNEQDRPIFEEFVERSKKAGLTGFGAGPGYMQSGSLHAGFGKPAVWGAGGKSANAADWLRGAYSANNYSTGGLVSAIDDGEDPNAGMFTIQLDEPEQEQEQEVAANTAIPEGPVPTPTPRPQYDGAVTSEGNDVEEPPTDDPYEQGRRAVREGLKRAMQQSGSDKTGAIDDPQGDQSHIAYLKGNGAAPRNIVREALAVVDPDKKMSPGERNMAALAQVYQHYMNAGYPEKAKDAAASLVQYYRVESNRYLTLAQAAASHGQLDEAAKAAVAAYANIPNGRDLNITPKENGYEISVTDQDGKQITKQVLDPAKFAAAAMNFNPATFDDEILNAAGAPVEEFKDLSIDDGAALDTEISSAAEEAAAEDEKLTGNMLDSVKTLARSIAGVTNNNMGVEQAFKLARAIASSQEAKGKGDEGYRVKDVRGVPGRVRVTIDGQTFVMSKNALADLAKTNSVYKADADAAEVARKNSGYTKGTEAIGKAFDQFNAAASDEAADTRKEAITSAGNSEEAVPSFTSPSVGDTGAPPQAVPSWDSPSVGDPGNGAIPSEAPDNSQLEKLLSQKAAIKKLVEAGDERAIRMDKILDQQIKAIQP